MDKILARGWVFTSQHLGPQEQNLSQVWSLQCPPISASTASDCWRIISRQTEKNNTAATDCTPTNCWEALTVLRVVYVCREWRGRVYDISWKIRHAWNLYTHIYTRDSTGTGTGTVPGRNNVASVRSRNIILARSRIMRSIFARYLGYTIVILLPIQSINDVYLARCINTCITSVYLNLC